MTTRLFESAAGRTLGAALVVHGLNNRPEVMDPLIRVLGDAGFHCLRVSLHRESTAGAARPSVIAESWINALRAAYTEIGRRYPSQPVVCLAYSLGALVSIRFLEAEPKARFARMALLAPPVALTRKARLVRFLTPLAPLGFRLPSLAPVEVRARRSTPLAEYGAMFELIDAVETLQGPERLAGTPTRVFLEADDELVSDSGVRRWLERNGLTDWLVEEIRDRSPERPTYSHFLVSKPALGEPAWANLSGAIVEHLGGSD